MYETGLIKSAESLNWAAPIVNPLKADDEIRRISSNYRLNLDKKLSQRTCINEKPGDILYLLADSKVFSEIDLKAA